MSNEDARGVNPEFAKLLRDKFGPDAVPAAGRLLRRILEEYGPGDFAATGGPADWRYDAEAERASVDCGPPGKRFRLFLHDDDNQTLMALTFVGGVAYCGPVRDGHVRGWGTRPLADPGMN